MTADEFKSSYIEASDCSEAYFDARYVVMTCNCGEHGCNGFAVVTNKPEAIKTHKELYQ